jgi:hypothetical protein
VELTLLVRDGGPQARKIAISSLSRRLTVVDEAGEARQRPMSDAELAALASALRAAHLKSITTRPGASTAQRATTLRGALDGVPIFIEESSSSRVDAAWEASFRQVKDAIERAAAPP